MRGWPFGKPKTPGFGISKGYYLSVLSAKATLPQIVEVVNPQGSNGAVEGFGAPLSQGATKDDLQRPMQRGAYAIATKDRKTVLKLIVVPKEEAGFDPDAFLSSPQAAAIPEDMKVRIRATWSLLQLTFETHDPMVYPALDFFQGIAIRLALLTEGVIADPLSQRYLLPQHLAVDTRAHPKVDAREHVVVALVTEKDGLHGFTLGMQKFNLPEFEILGAPDEMGKDVEGLLLGLAQTVLTGRTINVGDTLGSAGADFEAREGGLDRARWDGIQVIELIPVRGKTTADAIQSMARG